MTLDKEQSRWDEKTIIEFLPAATFVIDKKGKVTAWNKALEEMTGIKKSEILGSANYEYSLPFYGCRRPILIDLVINPDESVASGYLYFKREHDNSVIGENFCPCIGESGIYTWSKATHSMTLTATWQAQLKQLTT